MSSRWRSIVFGVVTMILLGQAGSTPVPSKNYNLTALEFSVIRSVLEGIPKNQIMRNDGSDWQIFSSTPQDRAGIHQAIQRIFARISEEAGKGSGNSYDIIPVITEEILSENDKKPPSPQVAYGGSVSGPLLNQQKVPYCNNGQHFYNGECRTLIDE